MKSVKLNQAICIAAFLLIIFIPGSFMFSTVKKSEMNKALGTDTLSWKNFPKTFTSYFNNSFYMRKDLISWFYAFRIFGLKENYLEDKVISGKEGWFYYMPNTDGYGIDDYTGKIKLSEKQLAKISQNIDEQYRWLEKRGIQYLIVLCPNKQTIYPEYLPASLKKGKTVLEQITEYLSRNSTVPVLDLRQDILVQKKKNSYPLYYKTDTHWNSLGGFYACSSILRKLNTKGQFSIPGIREYTIRDSIVEGRDITQMIGVNQYVSDLNLFLVLNNALKLPAQKPKAVIFHDSYYYYFREHFLPHF